MKPYEYDFDKIEVKFVDCYLRVPKTLDGVKITLGFLEMLKKIKKEEVENHG